jgi:hypothetical protein
MKMKVVILSLGLFVVCAGLVFVAPHHRRKGELFKPCTLGEVYREIFREMPSDINGRGLIFLVLVGVTGMWASLFPFTLVGMTRLWPLGAAPGVIYLMAGIVTVLGTVANFLAMLVSHMSFGFGVSNSSQGETPFIWIIPVFQILFGIASIMVGCSTRLAMFAGQWGN